MDISYIVALQRLELIKNYSNEILKKIESGNDLAKEVERIKGHMVAVSISSEELQKYLEANKSKLEQQPPPDLYKTAG